MKKIAFLISLLVVILLTIVHVSAEEAQSIFISEFMPNPDGSDSGHEWLELYNNLDSETALTGWSVETESASGNVRSTVLPDITIPSKSYFVILEPDVSFALEHKHVIGAGDFNFYNSGVEIRLLDSFGTVVDREAYTGMASGRSLERMGIIDTADCRGFSQPSTDTIGIENTTFSETCWGGPSVPEELTDPDPEEPVDPDPEPEEPVKVISQINDVRDMAQGSIVSIRGVVTADENIIEDNVSFIQDATGGIKIRGDFEVSTDALYEITGTVKQLKDNPLIDVAEINELGITAKALSQEISSEELSEHDDMLVKISGEIVGNFSTSFDVETTDNQTYRVSIPSGIQVEREKEDIVTVIGIVDYKTDRYRIFMRSAEDISVTKPEVEDEVITNLASPPTNNQAREIIESSTEEIEMAIPVLIPFELENRIIKPVPPTYQTIDLGYIFAVQFGLGVVYYALRIPETKGVRRYFYNRYKEFSEGVDRQYFKYKRYQST